MEKSIFVGRDEVFNTLSNMLLESSDSRCRVISIEGAGGIGKTTLINQVLRSCDLRSKGFLEVQLDGHTPGDDPVTKVNNMVQQVIIDQLPDKYDTYFTLTRMLYDANAELEACLKKKAEIDQEERSPLVIEAINCLIDAGQGLGKYVPYVKEILWDEITLEDREKISRFFKKYETLLQNSGGFFNSFKNIFSSRAQLIDKLSRDCWGTLAENFFMDITSILVGWQKGNKKKVFKYLPQKVTGVDNLLFFVDDYECFQNSLGSEFLLNHLLPKLERANFKSILLI